MSLTERDVLNTLSDAVALNMDFYVSAIHVCGSEYTTIRDHIRADNILVAEGNKNLAFYDSKTDILTTQAGTPPANLDQRALLLHECTHALIDVFTSDLKITRHTDELTAYLAQYVYILRSDSDFVVGPNNPPWYNFFASLVALIKRLGLDTIEGNGKRISASDLEPLRVQLAALPGVNYGAFKKEDPTGADGLLRHNLFIEDIHEEIQVPYKITANESYPDPSDDYLIKKLEEKYSASDVSGYGKRLRTLRTDFLRCTGTRAKELERRLNGRQKGDHLSELFHDRLSTTGRALLLRVLHIRLWGIG